MKCGKCSNTAVYHRKYSDEKFCSECFSNSMLRKTAKTISKFKMIKNNELVCVAVSGGKDSLALCNVLHKMSKTHNFRMKVITIDEGIPNYRDEALELVKKFCNDLHIEWSVYSFKELFDFTLEESLNLRESKKTSSCSICGTLRRRAFYHAAQKEGADVIATGHNLDDFLQTFFINLLSGDVKKIGWMYPEFSENRPRIIKPFCEIYESEIVFYAFTNNIPFQSEQCPHMNEGIRTPIREFFNSLENQHIGIKNNLYKSSLKLSHLVKNSNSIEKKTCQICGVVSTGNTCSVCKLVLNLKN